MSHESRGDVPPADVLRVEHRVVSRPREAGWPEFKDVIKANWKVLSVGFSSGLLLSSAPVALEPWSKAYHVKFLLGLFEHLGIGLIVAALAVIAYEWVSEARRAQIHSHELVQLLLLGAEDRIESAHKMLLGANADRLEPLRLFAQNVAAVAKQNDWIRKPLLAFFEELATKISENAKSLARVALDLRQQVDVGVQSELAFPDPAKLTDFLLRELLLALPAGGRYSAVSNALIWKDLTSFRDAHIEAAKAGVTIQRVFIIFQKADQVIADAQAIATIYKHYKLSKSLSHGSGGKYETRFVTVEEYEKRAPKLAQCKHFGVFQTAGKPALAFLVEEDNLSQFGIVAVGTNSPFTHGFDDLWEGLEELDDIRLRYMLRAERMRRIDSGSYSALSTFENWNDERLNSLHEDSMKAERRGVQIRRIFAVSSHSTTSSMKAILDSHAAWSREHPGYQWIICNQEDLPITLTSSIDVPYGIFKDRGKSGSTEQVLFEVYSGRADEPFEISGGMAEAMFNTFERFWHDQWPKRATVLEERFGPKASEWF